MIYRHLRVAAFCVAVLMGAAGCQSPASPGLTTDDATALRAALNAHLAAANGGDAARWAALYTEDAVMMPPNGRAVQGRSAIQSWLATLPRITDAQGIALEVEGAGGMAYVRGTYSMRLTIPGVPAPISQEGKLLQIYARQPTGSWLLARDIWNGDSP